MCVFSVPLKENTLISGMVKHELRIANYEFPVSSFNLKAWKYDAEFKSVI